MASRDALRTPRFRGFVDLERDRGPQALPLGERVRRRRNHVHGLDQPAPGPPESEPGATFGVGARRQPSIGLVAVQGHDERIWKRAAFVEEAHGELLAGLQDVRVLLGDQLQRQAQLPVVAFDARSCREERFRATREDLPCSQAALPARRAELADPLQAFLREVALELLRRERDRGGPAAVTDDPESRRLDPHEPRRLAALANGDEALASGPDREEALDLPALHQNGLAAKVLPDAQAHRDRRADFRPEGARHDPEVVRGERPGRDDQGGRRREAHGIAAGNRRRRPSDQHDSLSGSFFTGRSVADHADVRSASEIRCSAGRADLRWPRAASVQRTRLWIRAWRLAKSNGFSTRGLRTTSRNWRAWGVKAPPVMKSIRSAWSGAVRASSACSSMPVISGIIRSHRIRSNRSPLRNRSFASRAEVTGMTSCSLASMRRMAEATIGSSSTTRIRPLRPRTRGGGMGVSSTARVFATGSSTRKTVPLPSWLWTVISPPSDVTMRWQMASPRPVPRPTGLVVKNGLEIRPRIASGIPVPVSRTSTATRSTPSRRVATRISLPSALPSGIAWAALTMRFRNNWPRRDSLASTGGTFP